jgi:hypothetical protein
LLLPMLLLLLLLLLVPLLLLLALGWLFSDLLQARRQLSGEWPCMCDSKYRPQHHTMILFGH